jgi:twitching motility protein PilT
MLCTPAVRNLIREARTFEIPNVIETNRAIGHVEPRQRDRGAVLQRHDQSEDAIAQAAYPDKLERQLAA